MTCIPQSGGCERPFVEPFVKHLNQIEGSQYVHRACLDLISGKGAQPEALYEDLITQSKLVIERKSISWPSNYPRGHRQGHLLAYQLSSELVSIPKDFLYEMRVPMQIDGTDAEVKTFAFRVAKQIKESWSSIAAGATLRWEGTDKWPWTFGRVSDWELDENEPTQGLKFTFVGSSSMFNYIDPNNLPADLSAALKKIYSGCIKKFADYSLVRRVLVLDPHADLKSRPAEWWREVFAVLPPPEAIPEIWTATFEWIDDYSEDWIFEHLFIKSM